MNDITFCVLACAKNEKYSARLQDFLNSYGFKNTNKELKVKFVFLVEDEDKPDFISEDFVWYNCPKIPLSCRFLKYLRDSEIDSRWIMQVDDDSSTDIDKTCELLYQFYNHQDSMMLMGGRNTDLESAQQKIVKIMGVNNFFFGSENISKFDTHPYFIHAWEPTIVSNRAVEIIKKWNRLDEYFDLCLRHVPTFGDQTPYVAAKLSKVPIVECSFMSPFNKHMEYSAINLNGRYSHIHYVTDKWEGFDNFKQKMIRVKKGDLIFEIQDSKQELWEFWGGLKGSERLYGTLRLNEDRTVGLYNNDNEFFWEKENEDLIFLNSRKEKTCIMKKINEEEYSGTFLLNASINHKLKKK
jgi:hypothetical protein